VADAPLLAFDTSTDCCSVAVQLGDEIKCDHRLVNREHAALLLPMISELLKEFGAKPSDIQGVVFGQGPGSFTGVRIAAAAAQGLAIAAQCPVLGVSSLKAIASACARTSDIPLEASIVMPSIDARMDQIYAGFYRGDAAITSIRAELVEHAEKIDFGDLNVDQELILCGSGAERYEATLSSVWQETGGKSVRLVNEVVPHAIDLLRLSQAIETSAWTSAEGAQPVYLRNKVALTEAERSST